MAANMKDVEASRQTSMLKSLQQQDPDIEQVTIFSKFVVVYFLHQDGPNPGWRKGNIEGPVFLVRRKVGPRYQLRVVNQFSTSDLVDDLHQDWELDCQNHYVFYKVEDGQKKIRGLWFHEDAERQRVEAEIEARLEELRGQAAEPQTEPQPGPQGRQPAPGDDAVADLLYQHSGLKPGGDQVEVTAATVRAALHALADDDAFVAMLMQKLREHATSLA